jgi:16S rRNA A1518/A1519 N6-dimethyltransferase RsmA/KsgA/DIM1 with predicted DNA glycosylase/AP lyase activity
MMTQQQQEPLQPTAQVTITLQAQEWNQLLQVLADAPYKIVAPLIAQITQQATQGDQRMPAMNGEVRPSHV